MENLPYEHIRWIENKDIDVDKIAGHIRYEEDQGSEGTGRCCCLSTVGAWA